MIKPLNLTGKPGELPIDYAYEVSVGGHRHVIVVSMGTTPAQAERSGELAGEWFDRMGRLIAAAIAGNCGHGASGGEEIE